MIQVKTGDRCEFLGPSVSQQELLCHGGSITVENDKSSPVSANCQVMVYDRCSGQLLWQE